VGLFTCPLLLLVDSPTWRLYAAWIAWAAALPALLAPLLFAPSQDGRSRPVQQMAPTDAEAREQLAAIQRSRHE